MRYERISRTVTEVMGGQEHDLRFSLAGLEELEARTGLSFIGFVESIGQGQPRLSHLTDAAWIALKGCNAGMKRDDAAALVMDYFRTNGIQGLVRLILAVIGVSGIMGPEMSASMMKEAGLEEEEPAKNGEAAPGKARRASRA